MDTDVLITGAGPTGLVLACGLRAAGIRTRVVERATQPAMTSRANILHARGVEVLNRIGALGDLRQQALAPMGMTMYSRERALALMRFDPDPQESAQALFISQAAIESQLRQRFTQLGGTVEWGREVVGADQDTTGVSVEFSDGATTRAGWLVGCDGARSVVRGLAGVGFPGVPVVEQFLLADVDADWDQNRETSAGWFHRDGMLLAMPMRDSGKRWRLMANVDPAKSRLSPEQIVQRLLDLLKQRAGQTGVTVNETVWTSVFAVQRRLAENYRNGRILLAGDSAHIHSPIGGQGMNTGMGDAENLAWKLALVASGHAQTELLDTYNAERRPLAEDVLRNTTNNTRVLAGHSWAARLLRDWIFVPMLKLPAVQRKANRVASQLWVTYRRGPLGGGGRGELRPGDRVGDRECRTAEGVTTHLHWEVGPNWTIVAGRGADTGKVASIAAGHLPQVTTVTVDEPLPRILLVRPDGHLGWQGTDAQDLARWLRESLRTRGPV